MLKTKLNQIMKEQNLSSRQIASVIGVSHTTIIRALRGDIVDLATVLKISEWMGVKPSTLLNSMTTTKTDLGLEEKIAILLENSPLLKKELVKAIKAIETDKINPSIMEDVASYAAYRINLGLSHA